MNWTQVASGLSDILSLALVIRLFLLRLHSAYRVFCAFLLFEIATETITFLQRYAAIGKTLDYRITWLLAQTVGWVLSIWMVYALLHAILENLPGILRFSRRVLKIALPISVLTALIVAGPEYIASGASGVGDPINKVVSIALIISRIVSTICVLSLLFSLLFILWFPVRMPRNLALFSAGLAVYFAAKTFLLLFLSFWSHESRSSVSNVVTLILCTCLAYWLTFLNRSGEFVQVTLGHSWGREKQTGLLKDLEHLNAVLGRAGRG
jgi:hypothetical protein